MKKNLFIHLLPILFFAEVCYSYVEIDTKRLTLLFQIVLAKKYH